MRHRSVKVVQRRQDFCGSRDELLYGNSKRLLMGWRLGFMWVFVLLNNIPILFQDN